MKRLLLILLLISSLPASAQSSAQKEVLIIGVMHQLPEIVRTSYLPLLQIAKDYAPQEIYVECVPPSDRKSWDIIAEKIGGEMSDFWTIHNNLQQVGAGMPIAFDPKDLGRAVGYFQHKGDYANTIYYLYKINGTPKRALGDEFYDLSLPLAAAMGIDSLRSFDCRIYDKQYYAAIARATANWSQNGNAAAYNKLFKKDYNESVLPAMFGTYGRHSNSAKALQRAHDLNSFGFAVTGDEAVCEVNLIWAKRNEAMAQKIGEQVEASSATRSIVFVGCGHVVGINRALKKMFGQIVVKTID